MKIMRISRKFLQHTTATCPKLSERKEKSNYERQKTCGLRHNVREFATILAQTLPQMDEIYAIGKVISQRPEKAQRLQPQSFCRRISLTAQAFPRATCAECATFTRPMKMTKCFSGWRWKSAGRWTWSSWKRSWQEPCASGIWGRRGYSNGQRRAWWKNWHLQHIRKKHSTRKQIPVILRKRLLMIASGGVQRWYVLLEKNPLYLSTQGNWIVLACSDSTNLGEKSVATLRAMLKTIWIFEVRRHILQKKYQVFISSTYVDLIEARAAATQCLLDNDCIPVGMEQFPASEMSQMEYIKKMLDNLWLLYLNIRWKYGSLDTDGIGFTEKNTIMP